MKTIYSTCVVAALVVFLAGVAPLQAGVNVETKQAVETICALQIMSTDQTAAVRYVCTAPNSSLWTSTGNVGSKQIFTVVDLSGNNLKDGDSVRIRYTPGMGKGGPGDTTKSSYWVETEEGVKRSHDGDVFKLKQVDSKFALLTPTGKFVTRPTGDLPLLGISTNQSAAMVVDFIDVKTKASVISSASAESAPAKTAK
ncbi:MAG TPA: hypothetical protein VMV72_06695 [Verrucomicrobiae bacterium]|nr:hypothetical protein [Verrucomicrobiae bacterium]